MIAKGFYEIHLDDEAQSTIGTGRRLVFIHSVGRKYARIRELSFALPVARIPRRKFDPIARTARPLSIRPSLVQRIFRSRRRCGLAISKTAKTMLTYTARKEQNAQSNRTR